MIQFEIISSEKYPAAEQTRQAIDAGCGWIVIDPKAFDKAVVGMCRDAGVILTIEDDADLAKEHGVHGVLVSGADRALELRNQLGAEAIIGARIDEEDDAALEAILNRLAKADIDYALLNDRILNDRVRHAALPIVFAGEYMAEDVDGAISRGASGVMTSKMYWQ